ncbi:uncharacterized protein [Argopecten irradians]|uniref:uncharacterized protein n=1 Tax=Argopecten irradians TaxID=31199 RepID=UPI00371A520A
MPKGKKRKGVQTCFSVSNKPLFPTITPHCVVIDHLHMFLRISDKLFNLLVSDLRCLDNIKANSTFTSTQEKDKLKNVLKLESVLQMLGIHFELGVNVDSKKLEYRELTGPEKLLLLERFDAADFFDDQNKATQIQQLWDGFKELNKLIKSNCPDADSIESKAKLWCDLYVSCYQAKDITPYIHMLRYHVGELIRKHGAIVRYSQQGLEKLNDTVTKQFFRGTSHKGTGALKQVLEKQNRLTFLSSKKRMKEKRKCRKCLATDHNSATCGAR